MVNKYFHLLLFYSKMNAIYIVPQFIRYAYRLDPCHTRFGSIQYQSDMLKNQAKVKVLIVIFGTHM